MKQRTSRQARDAAQARAARRHAADIRKLVPLAKDRARRRGKYGITAGEIRVLATARGLLPHRPRGRELSYLCVVPMRAGLVATDRQRMSPLPYSRNQHRVYVHPAFAPKGAAA
jgi:hypothetical protein